MIAMCGLVLSACNSIESKVKDYEKACNKGDYVKAAKLADFFEEREDDLSTEQLKRIEKANIKLEEKALEE